ncbi:hypothetical protein [Pontibacter sp. G13]|uniref:hypothetical protein n=1 Tax=Pontibacter sp. G13 TaxID=3074898 RepID=UPI002889E44B|nr:hypothetical protein [Pontibacter sp. G13]WNJ21319.1 hypothetical protein RJD25_12690 [Pontibacter sp. G13]
MNHLCVKSLLCLLVCMLGWLEGSAASSAYPIVGFSQFWKNPEPSHDSPESLGCVLRISGRLIERTTGNPLKDARILIKSGDRVLTTQKADKQGNFVCHIAPEIIQSTNLTMKISYMDHVFVKDDVQACSQVMKIEINGAILVESSPLQDYKLPYHRLDSREVADVTVQRAGVNIAKGIQNTDRASL